MKFKTLGDVYKNVTKLQAKSDNILWQPIEAHLSKLMEEVGEVAQAILKGTGYKMSSDSPEEIHENLREELIDCMVMIFVLADKAGLSEEEMIKIFKVKLKKWEAKHITPRKKQ